MSAAAGTGFGGRAALVTGGGTGIGLACAKAIAARGARVMLAGRREEVVAKAAAEIGANAAFVRCDVTNDASVEAAVAATESQLGPLRLAVNAAGTGNIGSVLNGTVPEFQAILDTNLTGVYRSLRAEARRDEARGRRRDRQHLVDRGHAHAPLDERVLRLEGGRQHAHALRRR